MNAAVRIAATALLAHLTMGPGARPALAMVPTHGMMLDSVATSVAAELLQAPPAPGRPVVLLLPISGDTAGVLAQRLLERLRAVSSDVRVRERPPLPTGQPGQPGQPGAQSPTMPPGAQPPTMPPGASSGFVDPAAGGGGEPQLFELHARVDEAGVSYVRRTRSFPFGVKGYERLVSMRASATLLDSRTGQVAWAKSATASLTDVVPKREIAYVSGGSAAWNPPLPQGSGFRILEPLIVTGVVVGLVVLFYSNRN